MRNDDKLRTAPGQIVHDPQEGELLRRRQRDLWFVEKIQALPVEKVVDQRMKRFAARYMDEIDGADLPHEMGEHVSPIKKRSTAAERQAAADITHRLGQSRRASGTGKTVPMRTTLDIQSAQHGYRFEDRRFAGSVVAEQKRHRTREWDTLKSSDARHVVRIFLPVRDAFPEKNEFADRHLCKYVFSDQKQRSIAR